MSSRLPPAERASARSLVVVPSVVEGDEGDEFAVALLRAEGDDGDERRGERLDRGVAR